MVHLSLPEKIETDRLILERLRYEDAALIFYTYASKLEATKFLSWPTHRSINDTVAFLKYAHDSWNLGLDYSFGIRQKNDQKFVGSFGVINENGKIQFGYVFSPTVWGRGYATEVCQRMMGLLKKDPAIFRIGTFVDVENTASIKVLKKSGLVEEACLERWFRFPNQSDQPKDCILFRLPLDRK